MSCERASEEKGKAIPLKVSAPFHCALMKPAEERLALARGQVLETVVIAGRTTAALPSGLASIHAKVSRARVALS